MEHLTYDPLECAVFRRTHDQFGGLSNMAGGYPLVIGQIRVLTVEALYQALRYPHRPEIQQTIIDEHSPIAAKARSRHFVAATRLDWNRLRVAVMRWCLSQKLLQHRHLFGDLLISTGTREIVEYSAKDRFWGASPTADGRLSGANALGQLLMELRACVGRLDPRFEPGDVEPEFPDAFLLGAPVWSLPVFREPEVRAVRELFGSERLVPLGLGTDTGDMSA